jgi:hypothetical protein
LIWEGHSSSEDYVDCWQELYHHACHQFTLGEVAYGVVPHVVEIAGRLPMKDRVWPLAIVGTIVALHTCAPGDPPIPDDLQADYEAAVKPALDLATAALREESPEDVVGLLAAVAAFQGHCDLALYLFQQGDPSVQCPSCGHDISWREDADPDTRPRRSDPRASER